MQELFLLSSLSFIIIALFSLISRELHYPRTEEFLTVKISSNVSERVIMTENGSGLLKNIETIFPGAHWGRPTITSCATGLELQGRLTPVVRDALDKARMVQREYGLVFYIAGALTEADEEDKDRYAVMSAIINETVDTGDLSIPSMFGYAPHLHGTDPKAHPDVTEEEVRDVDFLFARVVPDFHINFYHPTAHGNAIEEGWAEAGMIPAINLVPKSKRLSRLVRGMNNILGVIEYEDFHIDGVSQLVEIIGQIGGWCAKKSAG